MSWSRLLLVMLLATTGMVVMACHRGHQAQTKSPEPPMQTAAEAEAVFADAANDLDLALAPKPLPEPIAGQPDALQEPPSPSPPLADGGDYEAHRAARLTPCQRACRALASMERAADRLCELTGEDDKRCTKVRERVEAAKERVETSCTRCKQSD